MDPKILLNKFCHKYTFFVKVRNKVVLISGILISVGNAACCYQEDEIWWVVQFWTGGNDLISLIFPYPSSSIPSQDGWINPHILFSCSLLWSFSFVIFSGRRWSYVHGIQKRNENSFWQHCSTGNDWFCVSLFDFQSLKHLIRVVTKILSCRVNTTSRRGIKRLGISFGSIFLILSNKSSRGQLS